MNSALILLCVDGFTLVTDTNWNNCTCQKNQICTNYHKIRTVVPSERKKRNCHGEVVKGFIYID